MNQMSSDPLNTAPSDSDGSRATWLGSRWAFGALAAGALALAAVLVLLIAGGAGGASASQKYGGLPKWLPKMKSTKASFEVATLKKPILSEEQGYTVHAEMSGANADVTALGPEFPTYVSNYAQEGRWPANKPVPSTFFITFARVHGTIPIRSRDFTVVTDTGQKVPVQLRADGHTALPNAVHSGQTVTFKAVTKTVEGQGAIRWAPNGNNILAAWIYQVELD
jgi:hypothetical protein